MVEAGGRGELDVLYSSGGNFLDVLPDPDVGRATRSTRVPLRVHQDIVVSSQMLVDPGEVVVLLPAATRYEQRGGGTETTTERRIAFSPEIPGPRIGEARSEWEIFADLARRVASRPRAPARLRDAATQIRDEIAASCPSYAGIEHLREDRRRGPVGRHAPLRRRRRSRPPTAGRASSPVAPPDARRARRAASCSSTRRGKQFNSMVLRGDATRSPARGRDALFIGADDADGARCRATATAVARALRARRDARPRVHVAPIRPGNVQVFFPEGNVLLPRRAARPGVGRARLQRRRRDRPVAAVARRDDARRRCSTLFDDDGRGASATRSRPSARAERRARTDRPGQYALDLVADAAALDGAAAAAGSRVVSEESGVHRARPTPRSPSCSTRSTARRNCARGIPYWAISLCALDADGPLRRAGRQPAPPARRYRASAARARRATASRSRRRPRRRVEDAVVALSGLAGRIARRGSSSARSARPRSRCATSPPAHLDGYLDAGSVARAVGLPRRLLLVCTEAGAPVVRRRRPRRSAIADPTRAASSSPPARRSCSQAAARDGGRR